MYYRYLNRIEHVPFWRKLETLLIIFLVPSAWMIAAAWPGWLTFFISCFIGGIVVYLAAALYAYFFLKSVARSGMLEELFLTKIKLSQILSDIQLLIAQQILFTFPCVILSGLLSYAIMSSGSFILSPVFFGSIAVLLCYLIILPTPSTLGTTFGVKSALGLIDFSKVFLKSVLILCPVVLYLVFKSFMLLAKNKGQDVSFYYYLFAIFSFPIGSFLYQMYILIFSNQENEDSEEDDFFDQWVKEAYGKNALEPQKKHEILIEAITNAPEGFGILECDLRASRVFDTIGLFFGRLLGRLHGRKIRRILAIALCHTTKIGLRFRRICRGREARVFLVGAPSAPTHPQFSAPHPKALEQRRFWDVRRLCQFLARRSSLDHLRGCATKYVFPSTRSGSASATRIIASTTSWT